MLAETLLITYIPISEKLPDKIDLTRCMAFKSKRDHNQCPCRHRPGSRFCGKHAQTKQEILINGSRRSARQTLCSAVLKNNPDSQVLPTKINTDTKNLQNNPKTQFIAATMLTLVKDPHLTRLSSHQIHDNFIFYQLNKYLINATNTENKRQLLIRFLRLLTRIQKLDPRLTKITYLQSCIRRYLPTRIRAWNSGPGALGPPEVLCINKEDFFNLDPIESIPRRFLFTYKAGDGFVYGFSIFSFLDLCTNCERPVNPYTRETIDKSVINRALRFWHVLESWSALDPEIKRYQSSRTNITNTHNSVSGQPNQPHNTSLQQQQQTLTLKARNKLRLGNIFKKIDYLGYRTNPVWLFEKPIPILVNFIKAIARNWSFQLGLSEITKKNILAPSMRMPTTTNNTTHKNNLRSFESLVNFAYKWSPNSQTTTPSQQVILCWILDILEVLVNNTHDQNTGALLILYSLYYIEPSRVTIANPWMN